MMRGRPPVDEGSLNYATSYNLRGPAFLKILFGDKVAGSVIGRGGQVVQEYESKTGAQIKVSPARAFYPYTNDRMVMVTGELECVFAAIPLMTLKLKEHGMDENSMLFRITVPNGSIPMVIGRGGEVVKQIQSRSGAFMHLCEKLNSVPETVFEIKGSESQVINAAREVVGIIQNDAKIKDVVGQYYGPNWSPSAQPPPEREYPPRDYESREYPPRELSSRYDRQPSPPGRDYHRYEDRHIPPPPMPLPVPQEYPRYDLQPPVNPMQPPPLMNDPTGNPELLTYPLTIQFVVPPNAVAFILGENGIALREYFDRTGATVIVEQQPDVPDVNVTITGPLCGVQAAHILVIRQVSDAIMSAQQQFPPRY